MWGMSNSGTFQIFWNKIIPPLRSSDAFSSVSEKMQLFLLSNMHNRHDEMTVSAFW